MALGTALFIKSGFTPPSAYQTRHVKNQRRERALIEACFKIQQRLVLADFNAPSADRSQVTAATDAVLFRVIG